MAVSISERIRYVREHQPEGKLSRREFAERLGVSQGVIQNAEEAEMRLKDGKIADSLLKHICVVYHVNYLWLTEGLGDMLEEEDAEAMIERVMAGHSEFAISIMKAFTKLPDEEWYKLRDLIDHIKKEGLS